MESISDGAGEAVTPYLPPGCWHNVMQHVDFPVFPAASTINKEFTGICGDERLWRSHYARKWSPENCVSPISSHHCKRVGELPLTPHVIAFIKVEIRLLYGYVKSYGTCVRGSSTSTGVPPVHPNPCLSLLGELPCTAEVLLRL
jgi:hypothetical protein